MHIRDLFRLRSRPEAKSEPQAPVPAPPGASEDGVWMPVPGAKPSPGADYAHQLTAGLAANAYVARCVDLRASACASVRPVLLDHEGQPMDDGTHPLQELLARPSPSSTWRSMVYELETDLAINGNAYLWIQRDSTADTRVGALVRVPPSSIMPSPSGDPLDPVIYWTVTRGTSGAVRVLPEDIVHLHGPVGVDGIHGISPLQSCASSVEAMTEAREWNTSLMRNGAKPSMTISTDRDLPPEQARRWTQALRQEYSGTDMAGRIMLLTGGMHADYAGYSAHDMDYTAGISQSARDIGIALGVPSALLSCADMTYSNMSESRQDFAIHTISPLLDQLCEALTVALPADGVSRITYDRQTVDGLSGDETAMISALTSADYLTADEKRARLGYGPYAGAGADVLWADMSRVTLEEAVSDQSDGLHDNLDDPLSNAP